MMDRNTKNKALTIKIVWQPESAEIFASCVDYNPPTR